MTRGWSAGQGGAGSVPEAQWKTPISPSGEPSPLVAMKTPQPGDLAEHLAGGYWDQALSSDGFLAGPSLGPEGKNCPL